MWSPVSIASGSCWLQPSWGLGFVSRSVSCSPDCTPCCSSSSELCWSEPCPPASAPPSERSSPPSAPSWQPAGLASPAGEICAAWQPGGPRPPQPPGLQPRSCWRRGWGCWGQAGEGEHRPGCQGRGWRSPPPAPSRCSRRGSPLGQSSALGREREEAGG